jgi:hypothetical protein
MAYKFQLGAAVLSGSIQAEDGIVSTDVDDATAANVVAQIDNGEIPIAKLSATTISGVGLGGNLNSLSKASNSGLALTSYNGSAAVSDLAVDLNDLAAAVVDVANDSIAIIDANDSGGSKKESIADLVTGMAGSGVAAASGQLSLDLNELTAEAIASGDFLPFVDSTDNGTHKETVDDLATLFAGAGMTATSAVLNVIGGDGITANANDVAVTAAQTTITSVLNASLVVGRDADNKIDFGTDNNLIFSANGAERLRITDAGNTVVKGNLLVEGTTTTIDSTTINVSSSFTFEGTANDFETNLAVVDPTADRALLLPNIDGNLAAFTHSSWQTGRAAISPTEIDSLASLASARIVVGNGSNVATAVDVTGDVTISNSGVTAIGATKVLGSMLNDDCISGQGAFDPDTMELQDTDELLLSDGGVLRRIDYSVLRDSINVGSTPAAKADGDTLAVGVNFMADMSSDGEDTLTLPASSDMVPGMSIKIKAPSDCSAARFVTIATAASAQKIDGADSIRLESPFAAVELIYVASNQFRVF